MSSVIRQASSNVAPHGGSHACRPKHASFAFASLLSKASLCGLQNPGFNALSSLATLRQASRALQALYSKPLSTRSPILFISR